MNEQQPQQTVGADGSIFWRLNGNLHRLDGPAVEWADGEKQWRVHGLLHREDGPAILEKNGEYEWWLYGDRYSFKEWKYKCFPFFLKVINTSKSKTEPTIFVI